MGVDVPGEALEHVVITKLPFAVPNHPLIEARLESIAQRGGNAFLEYTLPEAVLKFRQGSGRLIRSRSDTGMITVLDSRIIRKSYGRVFLASIPRCPVELISSDGESEYIAPDDWQVSTP
jgi:ATP-dependent DNA helicase DinG